MIKLLNILVPMGKQSMEIKIGFNLHIELKIVFKSMEATMNSLAPTKTVTYGKISSVTLEADFYRSYGPRKEKTIVYFHGGGLVYGSRGDLPEVYLKSFLDAGYDFLSVDYPLYPESSLQEIIEACRRSISWFHENFRVTLGLSYDEYVLFGRSAGGFIANRLAADFRLKPPSRLISLYSYFDLSDEGLTGRSSHYRRFPEINEVTASQMITDGPIASARLEKRYLLYVHMRQTGTWLRTDSTDGFSITEEELKNFPPAFLTASDTDTDVPFSQSLRMKRLIPSNSFIPVMDAEHDYDRNLNSPLSKALYERMLKWLDQ